MKHIVQGIEFDITLDSKNCLYELKSSDSLAKAYCESLLNLEIDQAISKLYETIESNSYTIGWKLLIALKSARGDKRLFYENPKRDQIICRCQGYSLSDLYKLEGQLDLKTLMRETSVGMVCASCRPELNSVIGKLDNEKMLYKGISYHQWREKIENSLGEYRDYAGIDLNSLVARFEIVDFPKIKIYSNDSDFVQDEKNSVRLGNYFSMKLETPVSVDLAISI